MQNHNELSELDLLLSSSQQPVEIDDFAGLDKLLRESLHAGEEAKRVKAARRALAEGGITKAEREANAALVQAWELKREWTPIAYTIMFNTQQCSHCGSEHRHFVGIFQQQEHKTSKIARWVPTGAHTHDLPKNRKENIENVGVCCGCAQRVWGA